MTSKLKKFLLIFLLGYLVFFTIGLIIEYTKEDEPPQETHTAQTYEYQDSFGLDRFDFSSARKNYASSKLRIADGQTAHYVDQKYEKIASFGTVSGEYDKDEKKVKQYIKDSKSLIQYEKNVGTNENRVLQLAIGVHPKDFDTLVAKLKTIGQLETFQSDVTDKTNEFNKLKAEREKLTKHKQSLEALKGRSGKIEELILLEEKILAVQDKLQGLGVSLGDFDNENEFSTVKFIMAEDISIAPVEVEEPTFMMHASVALNWATTKYFYFIVMFTLFSLGAWLLLMVVGKFKDIQHKME